MLKNGGQQFGRQFPSLGLRSVENMKFVRVNPDHLRRGRGGYIEQHGAGTEWILRGMNSEVEQEPVTKGTGFHQYQLQPCLNLGVMSLNKCFPHCFHLLMRMM